MVLLEVSPWAKLVLVWICLQPSAVYLTANNTLQDCLDLDTTENVEDSKHRNIIEDYKKKHSKRKSVGFSFIPFFNFISFLRIFFFLHSILTLFDPLHHLQPLCSFGL